jgi:hypothetical protein
MPLVWQDLERRESAIDYTGQSICISKSRSRIPLLTLQPHERLADRKRQIDLHHTLPALGLNARDIHGMMVADIPQSVGLNDMASLLKTACGRQSEICVEVKWSKATIVD